ncbi:IS1634 family transposase [Myroides marinus]|uniref:IS1634 family transposase n=2 Tax=Myroides marinus TaxID=703342 RepID=UPI0025791449|nr:IS1634 family transposase [Myroides marinus]MDM1348956.1 IS1634 family transposase [Myroides marinus]MDM1352599.1 IS1634 family transposase [Myroides marinus]MDM1356177.1 IS1634 family transposase [Myroides marinus]MDM1359805.1 IS1634 family transposase [Myroides marinus]MDM1366886.1 IS1634 family transposase [Myroides marinus]
MFIRQKKNKSGLISVQVIDKSSGKYKVLKTIGSSQDSKEIEQLILCAKEFINTVCGNQELDFSDSNSFIATILNNITSHKLVGSNLVLGKIFDEIGFNKIKDPLFKDLVLYRLIYPKSKLKTTEYLYRYEQKKYSEDELYRYLDKLYDTQKDTVQKISYEHTLSILKEDIKVVFYDVTTVYFEIDNEDALRKTGFSKEGKHQNPQIVLGLLVSKNGYPLAYDMFEGNKFEGHTMLPIIDSFKKKYNLQKLVIVADAGLLSNTNVKDLQAKNYEFILGARIKTESKQIKNQILSLQLKDGESTVISKDDLKLIVTYSDNRAKKDKYNREKGLKKLEKSIKSGKLTKSSINNRGYNKYLKLEGEINVIIDSEKFDQDAKWDGLKGYLTNAKLPKEQILENYNHLWRIEKAFRVAKTDLQIRPIYHRKQKRIEAHICLTFVAYKLYKEIERLLEIKKSDWSVEKVIEVSKSIFQIEIKNPINGEIITQTILLTDEHRKLKELFLF